MNKHIFFISILLSFTFYACGQVAHREYEADSIAFVNAIWETDTLDGFYHRHCHFANDEVFKSVQDISVIEIPRHSKAHLKFVADTLLTHVTEFASRCDALAGINGSFFNMSTGEPVCYLKIDGKLLGENTPSERDSVHRKYYQNATIRLLRNGHPRFNIPDSMRNSEAKMPDRDIMTCGPMLIYRNADVPQREDRKFVYARHPRTAVGLKRDGTIVLFVADGRSRGNAAGLSIPELTRMMRWLGCSDAVNLDGGGSSVMYIKGMGENGIVNHPCDNGKFDTAGERRVSNAILVVK